MKDVLFSRLKTLDFTPCLVVLTDSDILWKRGISVSSGEVNRIDLKEVVCVISVKQLCYDILPAKMYKELRRSISHLRLFRRSGFVISNVVSVEQHKWRTEDHLFWCDSPEIANRWISAINDCMHLANPSRPKKLLICVNPTSGYKKAERIYDDILQPMFHFTNVETSLFITSYRGHLMEYLLTHSLDGYDGVICVGGDGSFAEAAQGLLLRERLHAKLPLFRGHLPDSCQVTPPIRIGIIPAGSTDTVVFSTHGTNDVLTAALHIILGDDLGIDVAAVHSSENGSFLRYVVSMLGYGFHADLLRNDDKLRWMGPRRYDYSGFSAFLQHSVYEGELTYLPSANRNSHVRDGVLCASGCPVCSLDQSDSVECSSPVDSEFEVPEGSSEIFSLTPDLHTKQTYGESRTRSLPASSFPVQLHLVELDKSAVEVRSLRTHTFPQKKDCLPKNQRLENHAVDLKNLKGSKQGKEPSSLSCLAKAKSNHQPSWFIQGSDKGWKTIRGTFIAVNAFLLSCRCSRAANGPSPWAHLGDGCIDLIMIRECSRARFLQFLLRTANASGNPNEGADRSPFELPFVTVERVCAFRFRRVTKSSTPSPTSVFRYPSFFEYENSSDSEVSPWSRTFGETTKSNVPSDSAGSRGKKSMWCTDGELLHHENISVHVHRQLLRIFSRGPQPTAKELISANNQTQNEYNALFDAVLASASEKPKSVCSIPIAEVGCARSSAAIMISPVP